MALAAGLAAFEQALVSLFTGQPPDAQGNPQFPQSVDEAAQKWAQAYATFAAGAQAGTVTPAPGAISGAQTLLVKALAKAFQAGVDGGPGGLTAFLPLLDAAFSGFWAGPPPLPFAGGGAGAVSLATPGPSATMASSFAASDDAAAQAAAVASGLNTWTMTVKVTYAPPPGTTAPLT